MKRRRFIGSLVGFIGLPFIPFKPMMEIKSANIVYKPRKLKAKWTYDCESDLMSMMLIDIQDEIDQDEIDREVLGKLLTSAKRMGY